MPLTALEMLGSSDCCTECLAFGIKLRKTFFIEFLYTSWIFIYCKWKLKRVSVVQVWMLTAEGKQFFFKNCCEQENLENILNEHFHMLKTLNIFSMFKKNK